MTHPLMRGIEALEREMKGVIDVCATIKASNGYLSSQEMFRRDEYLQELQQAIDVLNDAVKKDVEK